MADMRKNIAGLFVNTRSRTIIIVTGLLLVAALITGLLVMHERGKGVQTKVALESIPGSIESIPGSLHPTQQYAKLQEQQNIEKAKTAEKTGQSAIPTIVRTQAIKDVTPQQREQWLQALKAANCSSQQLTNAKNYKATVAELKEAGCSATQLKSAGYSACDLFAAGYTTCDLSTAGYTAQQLQCPGMTSCQLQAAGIKPIATQVSAKPKSRTVSGAPLTDQQLQQLLSEQEQQKSGQNLQQQIQQTQANMQNQAQQLLVSWGAPTQVFVQGDLTTARTRGTGAGGRSGTGTTGSGQSAALIKAGEVMFAVLDTAVNSDEPGPVMATIVQGKYKGAKLLGSLTLPSNAQKVILEFTTLSLPSEGNTIPVTAYAIDPNTARTALSSHTDNHYLLRYGTLFASSFLEGFGNAFSSEGTSVQIDNGNVNATQAKRSFGENAVIGLGNLGEQWGEQLANVFDRPPTVEVYSGVGLGILFAQDVNQTTS